MTEGSVGFTEQEINEAFRFLPELLSLIKCLEAATQTEPTLSSESAPLPLWASEATKLASVLQKKIVAAKQLLGQMHGADYTVQEQLQLFEQKKQQLELKRSQLRSHVDAVQALLEKVAVDQ